MADFTYEVRRTNRKTVCVKISDDNRIIVCCSRRTSDEKIEEFLRDKAAWIKKHVALNEQRNDALSDIIAYKAVLVKGVAVPLIIGENVKNFLSDGEVRVNSLKSLKKLYITVFGGEFLHIVDSVCERSSLVHNGVSFKAYKARWGCCDACKEIKFNWKLLMLPERLWVYVIVHELCHTVHMNHSAAFYRLLGRLLPGYGEMKSELKRYSRLTTLY